MLQVLVCVGINMNLSRN